jgi:serine/threonine protein phosphatase PrpC
MSAPTPQIPVPVAHVDAAGQSHVGRERSRNEDTLLVATLRRNMFVHGTNLPGNVAGWCTGANQGTLLLVADGMGGQAAGDLASQLAVQSVADHALNNMPWLPTPNIPGRTSAPSLRDQLGGALVGGDLALREVVATGKGPAGMGTTVTAAYILLPVLYLAHVGDSRCYVLRRGNLMRLTKDHTVAEQLLDRGVQPDEVPTTWHNVLWNALGAGDHGVRPQVTRMDLEAEDVILVCSDGLTKHLDDAQIQEVLVGCGSAAQSSDRLVRAAVDAGGSDNVTAAVARIVTA